MEQVVIKDLYEKKEHGEETVTVTGWLKTIRSTKRLSFIEMNDGSCLQNVQVIAEADLENYEEISKLTISTTIQVTGTVVDTPKAQQPFEIHASAVKVVGQSDEDYPLQKKQHSYEYLRTIAHLRPRTKTFYAVFKIRSLVAFAVHQYLQEHGFVYVNTPIITSSDAEGAGEMFQVTTLDLDNVPKDDQGKVDESKDFFKKETNLTVSGQLTGEAFALALRNIYTFGPTFRAEDSHTTRHAAEFWMIEPEMAFADLHDVIEVIEGLLQSVIKYVLKNAPDEIQFLNDHVDSELINRLEATANNKFEKITYTQAVDYLLESKESFKYPVKWGIDFQTEHERYLCEKVFQKPVFVTDYPKEIKAFYMRNNDDGKTVAAVDLLVPGIGELLGGSQREERVAQLEQKIADFNLDPESYKWYLELRKYGETEHSGFGIGFERLLMFVTGMENIRDVIPFPRTPGNAEF
ncbi:asparagine--tRNA ligase [Xylocopilactobacillus apicola]|uniref:Asparagine--tRNA ligase n=1 Tax=Xylocopilactobacillus apicola TaxID=2932184 RepID=A0AAU9DQ57_9LACO|nr:asparagine--tRNA ligase [Xylocopilactobacillus apicola]BDR57994.1 asparagine--tRNA ligase [Xylocopilactobacillus apicola]